MKNNMNFIELCLAGEVSTSAIDDYVETWHNSPHIDLTLPEYLGMQHAEYALWVMNPSMLPTIISHRRNKQLT